MVQAVWWLENLTQGVSEQSGTTLDPETRARFLLALLGLVVTAIGAALIIWLSGRAVRRWMRGESGLADDSAEKGERDLLRKEALWFAKKHQQSSNELRDSPPDSDSNKAD